MKIRKILLGALASAMLAGALTVTASAESGKVAINEKNFPDKDFRQYVLDNCDKNGDKSLSKKEISKVVKIDASQKDISSLKGIEYFSNLEVLECWGNELTSLDVSKNTALTKLNCERNHQLTSLDVSKNTELTELWCNSNKLPSLDVSKNTVLTELDCGFNKLTSIDVSKNTALVKLRCPFNELTSLDVSKNTALESLDCGINQITSLDVSKNTALKELYFYNNQLTSLDVSRNTELVELWCGGNKLTSLDVSKNTALTRLNCWGNQLTSLDVSKNTELETLVCGENKLSLLDLNNNPHIVKVYDGNDEEQKGLVTDTNITIYGKAGSFAETYAKDNGIKFVAGAAPKASVKSTKPTGLKYTAANKQITLKWNAVKGATKYRVQMYTDKGWKTIARTKNASYKHTGLKNGSTYTYRVSAYVDGKWGKSSARLKAKAGA